MNRLSRDIATLLGATLYGRGDRTVCEAVNDHRNLPAAGGLFLALQGTCTDGHAYLAAAAAKGASAALVLQSRVAEFEGLAQEMDLIAVDDVQAALWQLASDVRAAFTGPVIAITGSVGKTTTKAMVGTVLRRLLGQGCITRGNHNNLLGAPMTAVRANPEDQYLVLELGSNAPGEVGTLAGLAQGDVAIVTAVAEAHLEGFGDLAGVLKEKASLPRSLNEDKLAIYPSSNELLAGDAPQWGCRLASYGENEGDDARIVERTPGPLAAGRVLIGGQLLDLELPIAGTFNLDNAVAALLVARELGLDLRDAAEALRDFAPESMRMEWRELAGRRFLVDAYNANPASVKAALGTVAAMSGRRLAALGSMMELGDDAELWHEQIGEYAVGLGLDFVAFVGPFARNYERGAARVSNGSAYVAVPAHDTAARALLNESEQGDVVLLKGSRSARMETILEHVAEETE